jgi:acyl-CoA thioester hydrolase
MHERRTEIRWSDLDAYAHVYHPVYLSLLEGARDQWLNRVFGLDGQIWDYVVARVAIDYRGALRLADREAVVRCRLERISRSSFTTKEDVLAPDGPLAVEAEVVIVAWDPAAGRSRPARSWGSGRSSGSSRSRRNERLRSSSSSVSSTRVLSPDRRRSNASSNSSARESGSGYIATL